jgi:disulfide bond formation protein DsbB
MKDENTDNRKRVNGDPVRLASYGILAIALAGMLGSLYYSNYGDPVSNFYLHDIFPIGEGFPPCKLCWYARILLYPIVAISLVGILKRDKNFLTYVLPLSAIATLLTFYHSIMQWFPKATQSLGGNCDLVHPCNVAEVTYLGFITIPFMGFIAAAAITILAIAAKRQR